MADIIWQLAKENGSLEVDRGWPMIAFTVHKIPHHPPNLLKSRFRQVHLQTIMEIHCTAKELNIFKKISEAAAQLNAPVTSLAVL
jgi:hypothetical protein